MPPNLRPHEALRCKEITMEASVESPPGEVTLLLFRVNSGDQDAMNKLIPLVYQELRRLACDFLRQERGGHTLQPTALVHEAYLCLAGQDAATWQNRAQFMAIAAQVMRRIRSTPAAGARASGKHRLRTNRASRDRKHGGRKSLPWTRCSAASARSGRSRLGSRKCGISVVCRWKRSQRCWAFLRAR